MTCVEIDHDGGDRIGEAADTWRDRNRVGWETLLPHFVPRNNKIRAVR